MMARPKKETPAADDNPITINYDSYIQMAEFLAKTLTQSSDVASRQIQIASSQLSNMHTLMSQIKSHTQMVLDRNDKKESGVSQSLYPNIHRLLITENLEIGAGVGNASLPIAPLPSDAKPPKKKKPKKERDPNAPKRPLTAFFLFLQEKRDDTAKKMPIGTKPGDIQKKMTDIWNSLHESETKRYKERYEENMKRYKEELKEYQDKHGDSANLAEVEAEEAAPSEAAIADTAAAESKTTSEEDGDEEEAGPQVKESSDESEESEEDSPPPKKESKKSAVKSSKEASPKKRKIASLDEKKGKKEKESASPEVSKKKRKADVEEPPKVDKKKKRKSQGYAGNTEDF